MNATPENFKPGERWLIAQYSNIAEVQCLEWSQSGLFVKVQYARGGTPLWLSETLKLLERLPDVESGNHETESKSGVEADSLTVAFSLWPCICAHCCDTKARLKEAVEGYKRCEAAAQAIKECAQSQNNETC